MANAYGYSPEEMKSVADTLIRIKGEISEKVSTAQSAVKGLIGTGFTTQAASGAYSEQFLDLSKALDSVNANLEPLGNFLKQYADTVVNTDNEFGSALRG